MPEKNKYLSKSRGKQGCFLAHGFLPLKPPLRPFGLGVSVPSRLRFLRGLISFASFGFNCPKAAVAKEGAEDAITALAPLASINGTGVWGGCHESCARQPRQPGEQREQFSAPQTALQVLSSIFL